MLALIWSSYDLKFEKYFSNDLKIEKIFWNYDIFEIFMHLVASLRVFASFTEGFNIVIDTNRNIFKNIYDIPNIRLVARKLWLLFNELNNNEFWTFYCSLNFFDRTKFASTSVVQVALIKTCQIQCPVPPESLFLGVPLPSAL